MSNVLPIHEFFAVLDKAHLAQSHMEDALMDALGFDFDSDKDVCPHFEEFTFDSYDTSFELTGIADLAWRPSGKQLRKCFALGFSRCWFNYIDHTERYCTVGVFYPYRGDRKPKAGVNLNETT